MPTPSRQSRPTSRSKGFKVLVLLVYLYSCFYASGNGVHINISFDDANEAAKVETQERVKELVLGLLDQLPFVSRKTP